jgi:hypothetical protein
VNDGTALVASSSGRQAVDRGYDTASNGFGDGGRSVSYAERLDRSDAPDRLARDGVR